MISEHFDAIKARLEAGTGLSGKVHDTARINADGGLVRDQYVILYRSAPETIATDRFNHVAGVGHVLTFLVDVRAVGTSPSNCGAVLDRVLTQLTGHSLTVSGRSCTPMTLESSGRVAIDQSVKDFLYYADVSFELISRPA